MFDPHRTRRSDSRYYTRKGQILQASRVNTNPVIDQRLVPIYRNFIIKNNLLPPPIVPASPNKIGGVFIKYGESDIMKFALSSMTLDTSQTVNIDLPLAYGAKGSIIAIYEDNAGTLHLKFSGGTAPQSGTWTLKMKIEGNVKCRYATTYDIGGDFGVTQSWYKGIYDTDENILISSQYVGFDFVKNLGLLIFD